MAAPMENVCESENFDDWGDCDDEALLDLVEQCKTNEKITFFPVFGSIMLYNFSKVLLMFFYFFADFHQFQ